MDPLSITASIVAVLQLTSIVIEYASSVKDSSKDRVQCANEALNLYNLLFQLRSRLEEANSNERWYAAARALTVKDGPFDQYKHALEQLLAKVAGAGGIKKIGNALLWKFSKVTSCSASYLEQFIVITKQSRVIRASSGMQFNKIKPVNDII
jgi:hypothetical protein